MAGPSTPLPPPASPSRDSQLPGVKYGSVLAAPPAPTVAKAP